MFRFFPPKFHFLREWWLCLPAFDRSSVFGSLILAVALAWTDRGRAGDPREIQAKTMMSDSPLVRFYEAFSRPNPDVAEMAGLMEFWATEDLPAALSWAATVPPGALRDGTMSAIVSVWSRRDPLAAADLLRTQISDPRVLHEAIQNLALQWGVRDLPAARRWGESLSGTQGHSALLGVTQAASASKYSGGANP